MHKLRVAAYLCSAFLGIAAQAQDLESFQQFAEVGVFDLELSADEANEIVRAGMVSEDPEIVELTIRAIGNLSWRPNLDKIFGVDSAPTGLPARSFSEVEGLKQFLIGHFLEEFENSNYSDDSVFLDFVHGEDSGELSAGLQRLGEAVAEGDPATVQSIRKEIFEEVWQSYRSIPAWPMIPGILCEYWPGDVDVLQIIWQIEEVDLSQQPLARTLTLLNEGRFTSPDANAFRMDKLRSAIHSPDENAFFDAKFAIEGLALGPEKEALPLIIEAGLRQPMVRNEALLALDRFADADLAAHGDTIQLLISTRRIEYLEDPEVAAIRRLEALFEIDGPAAVPD